MKKKRLRLVTTIAILAALFGSGGGTAWGQRFITQAAVNNEFGAGESAFITAGNHGSQNVRMPWSMPSFSYTRDGSNAPLSPLASFGGSVTSNPLATLPPDILLGGSSQGNTVIRTYTGNGFALGWISILNRVAP